MAICYAYREGKYDELNGKSGYGRDGSKIKHSKLFCSSMLKDAGRLRASGDALTHDETTDFERFKISNLRDCCEMNQKIVKRNAIMERTVLAMSLTISLRLFISQHESAVRIKSDSPTQKYIFQRNMRLLLLLSTIRSALYGNVFITCCVFSYTVKAFQARPYEREITPTVG